MADEQPVTWQFLSPVRTLVALAIFLVSAALLVQTLRPEPPGSNRSDSPWALVVLGTFAILGFAGANRGGATLDPSGRRLTRWWGPFIPLRKRHVPFAAIRGVSVAPGLKPATTEIGRKHPDDF